MKELGQEVHEGPTKGGGRALRPCGRLVAPPTSSPSLLVVFWSKKNHRDDFIPFGLRLVFLFHETLKQGKNKNWHWALGREQAQARAPSKGTHFGATRPRPGQRLGGGHCGAQAGITTRAFGRRGPTLVRLGVPAVPLQNAQLLAPFPLNIWGEAQGLCL